MAESAVICLLKELSTFLLSQSSNLGGELQREVQFITDELGSMRAFLRDAEAKEYQVSELQQWVSQVREVAYDIEDVLDEFLLRLARHRADGFRGHVQKIYCSIKNLRARRRISSEMTNLKSRVMDISERHKRYQLLFGNQGTGRYSSASLIANLDSDIRANSILVAEADLVGIAAPKAELLSQILPDNSHLKVVAVVGMGGLGKTTLVRKVYDDITVKKRFQIRAWLTISQNFHIIAIMKTLIQQIFDEINESVPPQVVESTDIIRLSAFVKDFLQNRSYILVLDDVWSESFWDAFKYVFPDGNHDGRVVLTTRIADVASAACLGSHDYIHRMQPLSDEDSWILFCNRTFHSNRCPSHLQQMSARILKKCHGLPLAIATIGGVLAVKDKNNIGDWEMILRSLGGEVEGSGKLDRIKRILLLSYNDLPHYLKSCFLYLSIFPEDHRIKVDRLIESWIGQGFVQEKQGMSSYDIAALYIHELVNRSLLQVASIFPDGAIRYCRVHDFWRDIIVFKSSEQNFSTIAMGNYNEQKYKKLRRLAIHDCTGNPLQHLDHCFRSLRTLEFFGQKSHISGPVVFSGAPLLKVLNLSGAPLENIPNDVFNLFHLKHLCLRHTQVRIIPKLIGKLQNLEILDLHGTKVRGIPVETFKLTKLSSLWVSNFVDYPSYINHIGFKSPDGIGKLISLQYLHAIQADNCRIISEIGKLTKMKYLSITNLRKEDGKEFLCSLAKLTNLQTLFVQSIREDETLDLQYFMSPTPRLLKWLLLQGHIERIPQWVKSLQCLTTLNLQGSGLKEDDQTEGIGFIQDLPNLLHFTLDHAYEGQALDFRSGGFQKLKKLYLERLERLRWVRVEDDHTLPSLQILRIVGCKEVEELPLGIGNLKKLKSFSLMDMSDEFVQKVLNLDEQSEEHQALAHVPEVRIKYWKDGEWHSYFQ